MARAGVWIPGARQLLWDKGQHSDNQPCASWELTPGNGFRRPLCGVPLLWGWGLQLFWVPVLLPVKGSTGRCPWDGAIPLRWPQTQARLGQAPTFSPAPASKASWKHWELLGGFQKGSEVPHLDLLCAHPPGRHGKKTRPLSTHRWPSSSHQFSNSSSIFLAFLNFSSSFHPSDAGASRLLSDGCLFILTRAKRLLSRVSAEVLPPHYVA